MTIRAVVAAEIFILKPYRYYEIRLLNSMIASVTASSTAMIMRDLNDSTIFIYSFHAVVVMLLSPHKQLSDQAQAPHTRSKLRPFARFASVPEEVCLK